MNLKNNDIVITGIGVSGGIAIGKAIFLAQSSPIIRKFSIDKVHIEKEISRYHQGVAKSKAQLQIIKEKGAINLGPDYSYIIDTHIMMLEDAFLSENTIQMITTQKINAEWALKESIEILIGKFNKINDEYMNERKKDIEHLGNRIQKNLIGTHQESMLDLDEPAIIIAHELTAADTAQMKKGNILGFATDSGGRTSHVGIIASALEIPAIVGLNNITEYAHSGDMVIIDGNRGVATVNPTPQILVEYEEKKERYKFQEQEFLKTRDMEAVTLDGYTFRLMGNIEYSDELNSAIEHGANGIGLFRSEYLYLEREGLPEDEDHFQIYKDIALGVNPDYAIIRTLDTGGEKILPKNYELKEANPVLGLRAIRFCLNHPDIFKTQLRGILMASHYGKLKIMYPMISGVEEVIAANNILRETMDDLEREGTHFDRDIQVGAMIEIPSAALTIEDIAREVDFFSIGTNDLIQYTLAIDRINEKVAHLYQPFHPSILRTIKNILTSAESANTPVGICGAVGGDPFYNAVLLGLGKIDSISMVPSSIPKVKKFIRSINYKDSLSLGEEALTMKTAKDVENLVTERLSEWGVLDDDFLFM